MKVLFYGTHPNQPIGYGKIANRITNYMADVMGLDVYYFGISNFNNPLKNRYVSPKIKLIDVQEEENKINSTEVYGVDIIERFMNQIKPDVFIVYNDIIVTCRLFNALLEYRKNNRYKCISYIDLVYDYEKYEYIQFMNRNTDHIFVFSDHWKENLIQMGIPENKIDIFYHGFNTDIFFEKNKSECRKGLNLPEQDFIILNTNRNSYRKALDITISAFLKFLKKVQIEILENKSEKNNLNIRLFLNCHFVKEFGYDIYQAVIAECIKLNLNYETIINYYILKFQNSAQVEDEIMNLLYNSCDVGINTCVGEGFGLCNMEQAALGIPQIVSNVGGLKDIFKDHCVTINPVTTIMCPDTTDGHNGDLSICKSDDFADALYFYYKNPEKRILDGKKAKEYMKTKYNWNSIFKKFEQDFYRATQYTL